MIIDSQKTIDFLGELAKALDHGHVMHPTIAATTIN